MTHKLDIEIGKEFVTDKKDAEKEMITIPRSWLDGLLALANKSEGDKNKENMWILIGYISSAKTILKYLK